MSETQQMESVSPDILFVAQRAHAQRVQAELIYQFVMQQIFARYNLRPNVDSIETTDGRIMRGAPAQPVAEGK